MLFYLGTHLPNWLNAAQYPLFISRRRLAGRKSLPAAVSEWALDSGGFSEVSMYGSWKTDRKQYADEVDEYANRIGMLNWAAPMDWMCEPWITQKTGLTIRDHQQLTIESVLYLRSVVKTPIIPVLQGWQMADYHQHVEAYRVNGIDLENEPIVGLGSVCRRQATREIGEIVGSLSHLQLHGFGVKMQGLKQYGHMLASADSMAWSFAGRRDAPLPECVGHINCANCIRYATKWRTRLLEGFSG